MKRLALALVALAFLATGCLEERESLTLAADGSGTIVVKQRLGKELSSMALLVSEEGKHDDAARAALHKELAKWQGVVAWTEAKAQVKEERIELEATGWFEDVSKLRRAESGASESFAWKKNEDGSATFERKTTEDQDESKKDLLDPANVPPPEQQKAIVAALKGLSIERRVMLPRAIATAEGATVAERTACRRVEGADVAKLVDGLVQTLTDQRKKVSAKETTSEKANEVVRAELKRFRAAYHSDMKLACKPGAPEGGPSTVREGLEAAKKAYSGSELAKRVEAARKGEEPAKHDHDHDGGMKK